jgi:hypothetical protein
MLSADDKISIAVAIKAARYIRESFISISSLNRLSRLSQSDLGRAIGRWYRQHFRIDCSAFMPEARSFSPSS